MAQTSFTAATTCRPALRQHSCAAGKEKNPPCRCHSRVLQDGAKWLTPTGSASRPS